MPIEGVAKKPSTMTYEAWMSLDKKAIATIQQCLAKSVYINVTGEKTT